MIKFTPKTNKNSSPKKIINLVRFGIKNLSKLSESKNRENWTFNCIHLISLMIFHHSIDWKQIYALESKKVEKFMTQYNKIKNCIIKICLPSKSMNN